MRRSIWWPVRSARRSVRDQIFALFRKALGTDEGKQAVTAGLSGLLRPITVPLSQFPNPYPELDGAGQQRAAVRTDVILITGRFRSGSTLIWNLFRHLDGCTAYYEPFNERRWFDPRTRGDRVDATHREVSDYWREYDGLESLGDLYREEWIDRNLYMDERFWNPGMKRYIELMIERAADRPVLQFNRVDFRLPWLRRNFPGAKIVHVFRHPRDQWCSTLVDLTCFGPQASMADFARHDKFYLRSWARDLKYQFPFLDEGEIEHPYQMYYYIWRLSYLIGVRYADYSLKFEDLVADPAAGLRDMLAVIGIEKYDLPALQKLIVTPELGKWRRYAGDEWFRRHESRCEQVLADFLHSCGSRCPSCS